MDRFQSKTYVDKQQISLFQDQAMANNTMVTLFCTLEHIYSNKFPNEPVMFDHYDIFNFKENKNFQEMEKQLNTQYLLFKTSYLLFVKDHGKYRFPDDFSFEKIRECLEVWRKAPSNTNY